MKKWVVVGLLVSLMMLVGGIGLTKEPGVLRWALIPAEEAALEMELFAPIGEYLEAELGIPIEITICSDYSAVVQAMRFGHAEMARFGPFNYILATQFANVEAIVRGIKKSTGKDSYYSLIVTHRYSNLESIDDLRGRSFAFVDPASCSGGLVPKTEIIKAGIEPDQDLGEVFYAGSHGAVILAIQNRHVDAGAVADNRLLDAIEKGIIQEWELVVIHRSEPICNSPIAVRSDLDRDLIERIKQAFLEMPKELALNYGTKCLGYVEASDADYDAIREIAEILELELE